MGDTMLLGVLRMPMDDPGPVRLMQFVGRARQAADRIEADAKKIERLRELLSEARDDIRDDVANRYPCKDACPSDMRRYKRDMDIVHRIDAALAEVKDA